MAVRVDVVDEVTPELLEAFRRLVPQLSSSAVPLGPDDLATVVTHPANRVLVARDAGAIVGTLTLVLFPIPTGLRAWIEDVVVDESARGSGVGAALTSTALRLATDAGARSVDLTSRPTRAAANRLYQRLGFHLRDSHLYRYQSDPPPPAP